jgi:hypothetical protein
VTSTALGAVAIQGPDTGGLKVGAPGGTPLFDSREWFRFMDEFSQEPAIPIINSANKAGTFIYLGYEGATVTANMDLLFAELSGSTLPGM